MLADCTDLTSYLHAYGALLGARADAALDPLFVPGRDPHPRGVAAIDGHFRSARHSRLFGAQADVLGGIARLWSGGTRLDRRKAGAGPAPRGEKTAFLIGECGTGKSAMGAAACHVAAKGKPYRGLILCPDHLIDKWKREVAATCPGAVARSFADWTEVLALARDHAPPAAPEWWVLGRDQSKFDPLWEPRVATRRVLAVDRERVPTLRARGVPWSELTQLVAHCPRCGTAVVDAEGNPVAVADLKGKKKQCQGTIVRHRDDGVEVEVACKEPLWQFVAAKTKEKRAALKADRARRGLKAATAPWRYAPYRLIHSKMRRHFDYLVLDEVHELKGDDGVAQANAAGALAASARKVVAMTGTLIGGYADHLFPILFRLAPHTLVREGFAWGRTGAFNEVYGKIQTTIVRSTRGGGRDDDGDAGDDHVHSKGSGKRTYRECKPGIMPQLFGAHLLERACFLMLEQVAEGLPALDEEIVPVAMDAELAAAYHKMERELAAAMKDLLRNGNKSLLGPMLNALICYPDHPHGWGPIGCKQKGEWVAVSHPMSLDPATLRNKEAALVRVCDRERSLGRKCWVYINMTQERDIGPRLTEVLEDAGLRVGYLRSSVPRPTREAWIYRHAPGFDVVLSHPKLVETGLDLFALDGNHNFPTLIFDQTGYNLFTLRQASRRSWRIGQPLPCRTVFLYYVGTMQERGMALMGRKLAAAEALEGKFSAEGLAAMGEESDATLALARALADRIPIDAAWRRDLGYGDAPALVVAAPPPPPPVPPAVVFTPAELAVMNKLFGRIKGKGA